VVIPNGIDLEAFAPSRAHRVSVREELGADPGAPLIGLFARFDPQKNHRMFLAAAAKLHESLPEARFVLAGGGMDASNAALAQWIDEAGVAGVTHLLGLRADMPRLTAALDVACSSSSWGEAFPLVLGEAMACGVPCVATDLGDVADIVSDCGRVVPPDDPVALALAMEALLRLPEPERRALGVRARSRIEDRFDVRGIAARYESMYISLAASG
jgi:glycosyltransferase involved in cell wall biosynthesis